MKGLILGCLFIVAIAVAPSAKAAEKDAYLVYADSATIEQIKVHYSNISMEFEELPLIEIQLTEDEKKELQRQYKTVEIFESQKYETSNDIILPSFNAIKAAPQQTLPFTGKGVKIAVLDTGIDTEHPDLKVAGGICTASVCAKGISYDDNNGHGTHVAGVIAAKKNSRGIVGIAPDVDLYAIKAMNSRGTGSTGQIVKGVEWAMKNEIDILNLSISVSVNDRPLEMILQKAYEKGMLIVASAGNEGQNGLSSNVTYPAKYSTVIAVGSLNTAGKREVNSSFGPEVEIMAPGTRVFSTFPIELDLKDEMKDGYRIMSGTSMSAPHVTGVLAIYKQQHPSMSAVKLRQVLQSTAKDLGGSGRDKEYGFGLLQFIKKIETVPFIETTVTKGEIIFELKNKELAKGWMLKDGLEPVREISDAKWQVFKTKGQHSFTISYKNDKQQKVDEVIQVKVNEPAFNDVTMNHWFAPHVSYLYSKSLISGYPDGSFKSSRQINRAEALILIGRAHGLNEQMTTTVFNDVGIQNRASGFIQSAYEAGIISGFKDGTFKPYQSVTRAEMALLIHNAYKFEYEKDRKMGFTDMHSGMASYDAVQALTQQGITLGISSTKYAPSSYMTRSAFAVFLARAENEGLFQ